MRLKDLQKRYEYYSNPLTKKEIGGSEKKFFVRINDNKVLSDENNEELQSSKKEIVDSVFFRELYESLMSGQSSYQTYLNDLFLDDNGKPRDKNDIYVPKFVSVMIKEIPEDIWLYAEVVGSRLANLLKIPVVYTIAPCGFNKTAKQKLGLEGQNLMSVDFVPEGYEVENLEEMGFSDCGGRTQIANFIDTIKLEMPKIAEKYGLKVTPERMDKFLKDFCLQYLFRSCLCGDCDCDVNNYGIFYNSETGDFRLSPVFDMEGCFSEELTSNSEQMYKVRKSIAYINKLYPDLLKDFIIKSNKLLMSRQLKHCMQDTMDISDKPDLQDNYDLVKSNINTMTRAYNDINMFSTHEH
ncbi:MAG: hypothetical protein ACI4PF_06700 [Christensenellales bacterium]